MEGILKVTPEKLTEAAGEFQITGNRIKAITDEMMAGVNSMKGVWQGEAAESYSGRFHSLQADMDKIYRMISEHVEDLQEMARQYQAAESANVEEGSGLAINIVT